MVQPECCVSARFACGKMCTHMSYAKATLRSLSPMIGKLTWFPEISLISLINQLGPTLGELRLKRSKSAELSCADRGIILRVGEEDNPVVADELVEVDRTLGGLGFEIGCD